MIYNEYNYRLNSIICLCTNKNTLIVISLKFALNNVIVVRCNILCFGVNFDKILLNKNIQKRIFFIYNNEIAAARVELWSSSTNAK